MTRWGRFHVPGSKTIHAARFYGGPEKEYTAANAFCGRRFARFVKDKEWLIVTCTRCKERMAKFPETLTLRDHMLKVLSEADS